MNVGVRFCGGCRSLYDRGEALEAVKTACPGFEFEYFTNKDSHDIILVINGCFSACAAVPGEDGYTRKIMMGPVEADVVSVICRALKEAEKEK